MLVKSLINCKSASHSLNAAYLLCIHKALHGPRFLAFLGVPWGPKNTSHILLTSPAFQHPGSNKGIVLNTFFAVLILCLQQSSISKMKADSLTIKSVRFKISVRSVYDEGRAASQ